ncbi:MAG: HAMP domain-containing protein [Chloroflexi bacterium]|nr:HAMP domain-containing protein [Chloroflexota bacterium]
MSRSLYWKITLPLTLLILVSMGILGSFMVSSTRADELDSLRSHLIKEASLVAEASLAGLAVPAAPNDIADAIAKKAGKDIDARVTIIARDGTVLGDSWEDPSLMENHSARPEVTGALASGVGESSRYSITVGQTMMYVAVPVIDRGAVTGIARVALPLGSVQGSINSAIGAIAWTMAIATALVILATALIARMITRPVRQMTRAVLRIASGQLGQRIPIRTGDELGQLGRAFNEMSASLKEMMEAMTAEKSKLAMVLSSLTDGVMVTDAAGHIVLTNPAAEGQFRFRRADALNRPLIEVIPDHEIDELLKRCLETGASRTGQVDAVGGRFLRVVAIPLAAARPSGAVLLFQDLTEMRTLQTMRRELVGNVSHELRTPLASVKALIETLQDGAVDDGAVARDFLNKVDIEVDRIIQMVAELTELSRIETGRAALKLAPVNLNLLVTEAIAGLSPQAERQKVALLTDLHNDLPPVRADRERIQQVIINIVHNAIKFTPPGGKATIRTSPGQDSVAVSVSDTGAGISREDLPHVFERFFKADRSRSGSGTGLGLAIAKHTVQAHGGRIWAESEEGKGSTFSFSLPLGIGIT